MGYGRPGGKCSSVGLDMVNMSSDGYAALKVSASERVAVPPLDLDRTMTLSAPLLFSTMEVTKQAFYQTALSYAVVNLKPIVPGRESRPFPRIV